MKRQRGHPLDQAEFCKTTQMEALAEMAALSVSAFHRYFTAVTSPLQYQKYIRLLQARSLLIAGEET